ncbi:hypothetical protein HY404_03710 [Candidatus Microgenomates bacterium]|nr:hypothetical protein [Candidatus Microgenomates bacterium]
MSSEREKVILPEVGIHESFYQLAKQLGVIDRLLQTRRAYARKHEITKAYLFDPTHPTMEQLEDKAGVNTRARVSQLIHSFFIITHEEMSPYFRKQYPLAQLLNLHHSHFAREHNSRAQLLRRRQERDRPPRTLLSSSGN